MLVNFSEQIEKLKDVRSGNIKEGLKLGVPAIDEWMRYKPSNFNVILGHANVGKTTTILFLMLNYTIKHKLKWLVYSSENEPYQLIKKFVEFLEGKPINKIEMAILDERVKWINQYFKFIDPNTLFTYKELLNLAGSVKDAWNYDGFLIDPFNSLIKDKEALKGLNSHEYDYLATSEMRVFCKTRGVSIWLNTHANTEALRKKHGKNHPFEDHPIPPMAADVEGGGKFINRADDFICIHRYISHETLWMVSEIHVRKVKDIDTGGRPTPLEDPIRIRSMRNNVGFEINGKSLIEYVKREQQPIPF